VSSRIPAETEVLLSCSHIPATAARRIFNVVLRSGHFRASRGHRMERRRLTGHEFLYCVEGSGYVLSGGRRFRVEPSHVAWLSGYGPCAHCADETLPWEVLWMRVEGHQFEQAWAVLLAQERPVFEGLPKEETRNVFQSVNALLSNPPASADVALNCRVAELLGSLVESRQAKGQTAPRASEDDYPELRFALAQMAASPERSWRALDLAKLSGWSERHFFRRFKQATGISPINWLRRERIGLARTKLVETNSTIKQVAEQVGYNDVFFFSRDFKRCTGLSPSRYRREPLSGESQAQRLES
jgi:AraC-like DNA-binding protein